MGIIKYPMGNIKLSLCYAIEPALRDHCPRRDESLRDRIRRLAIERDTLAKVEACLKVLRDAGLLLEEPTP